jgi:hypothetical protein
MKYTVVTTPVADHQLAEIWLAVENRQDVADAFNHIESVLRHDARLQGREHPSGWRAIVRRPLAVTFRVSEDDCLVTIMSVFHRP